MLLGRSRLANIGCELIDHILQEGMYHFRDLGPTTLLEYSRLIKLTAECTAKVLFPYMVYKYVLPICHWTWHYIAIANSCVFNLQLLGTH